MKRIEWRNKVDKTQFGRGPWMKEADAMQWIDDGTGLPCLLIRNSMGALCGYVGIPPTHPSFGVSHKKLKYNCHGGLSHSNFCTGEPGDGICHVPEKGEPDRVWWVGFHCCNSFDIIPSLSRARSKSIPAVGGCDATYKDVGFVQKQCARLAQQIAAHDRRDSRAEENRSRFNVSKQPAASQRLIGRSPWNRRRSRGARA